MKNIFQLSIILTLATLITPITQAQDNANQIKALQEQVKQLQAELKSLKNENAALKSKLQITEKEKDSAQKEAQAAITKAKEALKVKDSFEAKQREFYLDVEFDQKSNTTSLTSPNSKANMTRGATRRHHWINFSASYPSKTPQNIQSVNLHFQSFFTGTRYRDAKSITFIIAGKSHICPVTNYDNVPRRSAGRKSQRTDDESLTVSIPKNTLLQLANSKTVDGKVGPAQFSLTKEQLTTIQTLVRELKIK